MQKKFFYQGLVLILGGLAIITLLVVKYDPFQQFGFNKYGRGDQRLLNPGIAKNYDYKIAVIGTSTSENILKKDLENLFDEKAVNLSLAGSSSYEQRKLLEIILKAKKANTIIYGLDAFSYNREINESRVPLQKFIYTDSKLEKIKYFYNFETLKNVLKAIVIGGNSEWINQNGYWGDKFDYSEKNALCFNPEVQYGAQNIGAIDGFKKGYSFEKMKNNFDEFYKLIELSPKIEYKIYFPPYASIWWYFAEKYNCMDDILKFKGYVINKLKDKKNIQIYDFQSVNEIVDDLNNYKDIVHYNPIISKQIITLIKKNEVVSKKKFDLDYEVQKKKKSIKLIEKKYQLKNLDI